MSPLGAVGRSPWVMISWRTWFHYRIDCAVLAIKDDLYSMRLAALREVNQILGDG